MQQIIVSSVCIVMVLVLFGLNIGVPKIFQWGVVRCNTTLLNETVCEGGISECQIYSYMLQYDSYVGYIDHKCYNNDDCVLPEYMNCNIVVNAYLVLTSNEQFTDTNFIVALLLMGAFVFFITWLIIEIRAYNTQHTYYDETTKLLIGGIP